MSKLLPLYPGAKPCQRTGYCCETGPCAFGTWDAAAGRCAHLSYEEGKAVCARFEEILALPQERWWMNPAFGAGCCSPLNPRRTR
jgi:hypothetical protein